MPFTHSKRFRIDAAQCGTMDSTDFPVAIAQHDTDFATPANGGKSTDVNGYGIRPYADVGLTNPFTDYELVYYDPVTGIFEMHVKVPTLSVSVDGNIYLALGDSSIVTDGSSANTWDTNHKGVWHLGNSAGLTNRNSVTGATGTTVGAVANSAQMDGGALFNGVAHRITTDLTITPSLLTTIEAWVYRTGDGTSAAGRIVNLNGARGQLYNNSADSTYRFLNSWSGGLGTWGIARPSLNVLHHVVVTYDANNPTNDPIFYVDGVVQTLTVDTNASGTYDQTASVLYIGNNENSNRDWFGVLDEIRWSDVIRSASWVTASYNNQKTSSTFLTPGTLATLTRQIAVP